MKAMLQAMGEELGLLEPWERPADGWEDHVGKQETWSCPIMAFMGLAWEAAILPTLSQPGGCNPGPMSIVMARNEVVHFSPDWVENRYDWPGRVGKRTRVIGECKLTWRSGRKSISENWWMPIAQSKSYCMATGVNCVIITVGYVNGIYEKHVVGMPLCKRYWIQYDQYDLDMQEKVINEWLIKRVNLRAELRRLSSSTTTKRIR